MDNEKAINAETLAVFQQVLRAAMLSVAASARVDMSECALLMQSFVADQPDLHPQAVQLLNDLANGFDTIARGLGQKANA